MASTLEELHSLMDALPLSDQERVLAYARELAHRPVAQAALPPGSAPEALLRIIVSPEVGDALQQAYEESGRIDTESWNLEKYLWK
ncbi:MAG: hypothetical protein ABI068_03290 [Ktedonobacterales bacterium]